AGTHGGITCVEVVDDGSRNDRHRTHERRMAPPVRLQCPHHPVGGGQAESRAPREDDCLRLLDAHPRLEESGFAGSRGRTAELGGHAIGFRKDHHRATRAGSGVGPVADTDPFDGCEGVVHPEYRRGTRGPMSDTTSFEVVSVFSAHSSALISSEPWRPIRTTSSPTSTGSSPTSTTIWSMVTVPASGYRRPRMSTSPPVAESRRGIPSAQPIGTVTTFASLSSVRRRPYDGLAPAGSL